MVFAPEARRDLLDLGDWIAERAGAEVALNYIARIEAHCLGFEFSGERGQRRDDIRPGLRMTGFGKRITIVFALSDNEVTILGFHYGGRNWLAAFE